MKIFCNNCKHHKSVDRYSMVSVCKLTKYTINNAIFQRVDYKECSSINDDNNCKDYKPNWYHAAANYLKKEDQPIDNRFEILDI